jgi:transposase-like protein
MKQTMTPAEHTCFNPSTTSDVMLMRVRWYVAYWLSVRNVQEMMAKRGIEVDHWTGAPEGDQAAARV